MNIVHLLASPFLGGPEHQVLGLCQSLPTSDRSKLLSFGEGGRARPLLERARELGFDAVELRENWPHLRRAAHEVAEHLRAFRADVLCTSGYKPDVVGWWASRLTGVPAVAIAHGWTGATWKVRLNERLDRWAMRRMAAVVSVSHAQAVKVARAGVPADRNVTIHNSVDPHRLAARNHEARETLLRFFPKAPDTIVLAGGRLSPEKGFDILIDATARVAPQHPRVGFLVFGDGPLRTALQSRIEGHHLQDQFVLGGFQSKLDQLLASADMLVLSSHTEGLPVVVLEAMAAGLPIVATRVGGIPEVIEDDVHGRLVNPGDAVDLAAGLQKMLSSPEASQRLGCAARTRAQGHFTFAQQSRKYRDLFTRVTGKAE